MALYIPAARRRRKLVVAVVVAGVLAGFVGFGFGRVSAPTAAAQAQAAKANAKSAAGQLEAFPIHYAEARSGVGDRAGFDASLSAGVKRTDEKLVAAFADSAWLDDATRVGLRAKVAAVQSAADRNVSADEFASTVRTAVASIYAAFGQSPTT